MVTPRSPGFCAEFCTLANQAALTSRIQRPIEE
jgi:hypothetical protein